MTVAVRGFSAKPQPDGSLNLTLVVDLGDRGVTVPLSLSPADVRSLKETLDAM